jgi:hypothetical protein
MTPEALSTVGILIVTKLPFTIESLPLDTFFRNTFFIHVPDQIRIWTIRVWSGPNPYTHMVRPYAYGHQRARPNQYLDHMHIK